MPDGSLFHSALVTPNLSQGTFPRGILDQYPRRVDAGTREPAGADRADDTARPAYLAQPERIRARSPASAAHPGATVPPGVLIPLPTKEVGEVVDAERYGQSAIQVG